MASAAAGGLLEGMGAPPPKIRLAAVSPLPREWQPARGPDPTAIERVAASLRCAFGLWFWRGGEAADGPNWETVEKQKELKLIY